MALFRRHTEVLAEAVPLAGQRVLDVGCGDGRLLAWLARRAALATGVDPNPAQLARARAADATARLARATGEALPFADGSFEVVLHVNSLHHVPPDRQLAALAETARVLRPGGDLVVVEPLPDGPWFELMRPLEDETAVRARAQDALRAVCRQGRLSVVAELAYPGRVEVPSLAAALDRLLAAGPDRAGALEGVRPELERRFARLAEPAGDGYAFAQPMRLDHLRRPA